MSEKAQTVAMSGWSQQRGEKCLFSLSKVVGGTCFLGSATTLLVGLVENLRAMKIRSWVTTAREKHIQLGII